MDRITQIARRFILPVFAGTLVLMIAFSAGFLFRPVFDETVQPKYPLLDEALQILRHNGIKEMPPAQVLEYGLIRGAVQAYGDPYTIFIEPSTHELQTDDLEGHFGGIGVRIEKDPDGYIRIYPFPNSPASLAGVLEGELLLAIDDWVIPQGSGTDPIQAAIRGPVGESVRLIVAHSLLHDSREVIIQREEVPLPSITWNLLPDEMRIGIIQINVISASTAEEISQGIEDLTTRGASHIILDLRNNGGGLVDAGVDISQLFLCNQVIVYQQYHIRGVEEIKAGTNCPYADLPIAVLVNQNTASAAEIIAGALQVSGRAKVIGEPTFGKDSIQLVFTLSDQSSIHVTAARWWLPGNEDGISASGIQPDTIVEDHPSDSSVLISTAAASFDLQ